MTDNTPKPPFNLTQADINSALWKKISGHLDERLAKHRRLNDKNLSVDETARLRGRISEVKQLLGLNDQVNKSNEPNRLIAKGE